MAKEKKLVEAITSMDVDFAQWYTDVVKKSRALRLFQRAGLHDPAPLRLCHLGKYPTLYG